MKRVGSARAWARLTYGAVVAVLVIAGGFTFWYRAAYNVMPGQSASTRVHWCGRDYESSGSPPQTWRQISGQQRLPLRAVGHYPPLGLGGQELFAGVTPEAQRSSARPPLACATVVYLRTGSNQYVAYALEGGP
jgi:hypothetical protein